MSAHYLFTMMNGHGFAGRVGDEGCDSARRQLVDLFNEGRLDNMWLMFLIPISKESYDRCVSTATAQAT